MEVALEAGAEDFKTEEEGYEILTSPGDFEAVHKAIDARGIACEAASVTALSELTVEVEDESARKAVSRLLEALDDHDDVQQVYSNADLPDEG